MDTPVIYIPKSDGPLGGYLYGGSGTMLPFLARRVYTAGAVTSLEYEVSMKRSTRVAEDIRTS